MEDGCRALYLGPELPSQLKHLASLTWVKALEIVPLNQGLSEVPKLVESGHYDCIAVTSPRAAALVKAYIDRLPYNVKVYAVGPATAKSMTELFGLSPTVPSEFTTGALGLKIVEDGCRRVLTFRSSDGDDELEVTLRSRGVEVTRLNIYKEVFRPEALPQICNNYDVVIASSRVIAEGVCLKIGSEISGGADCNVTLVAIGPKAAAAVKSACPSLRLIAASEHTFNAISGILKSLGCR